MSRVDVLIITALKEEHDAAATVARSEDTADGTVEKWEEQGRESATPYLLGDYVTPGGNRMCIALARPTRMGSNATLPIASALAERLRPGCLAMCGVCAGNPGDLALGDVVIADMVYQYDEGKRKALAFEGDARQFPMDERWVRSAQDLTLEGLPSFGPASPDEASNWILERLSAGDDPKTHAARTRYFPDGTWEDRIRTMMDAKLVKVSRASLQLTARGRSRVQDKLLFDVDGPMRLPFQVKVGPIASGNVVVKDGITWDSLKASGVRTVLGLEMEAAAIGGLAHRLGIPQWVVVKGVMDHADPRKDDRYKHFAARASAEVLFRFLARQLARPGEAATAAVTANTLHAKNAQRAGRTAAQHGLSTPKPPTPASPSESKLPEPSALLKRVFVIGGETHETSYPNQERGELIRLCLQLGQTIASAGAELIACSPFQDSVDVHTVAGYVSANHGGTVHFHRPRHHHDTDAAFLEMEAMLGPHTTRIVHWFYPGPETEEGRGQAWLLCQLQALEEADAVVAIGGRPAKTASTILHLAESRRIPLVPYAFFGGVAKQAFDRRDWQELHPQVDWRLLNDKRGITQAVRIASQMLSDRIAGPLRDARPPRTFFISRARADAQYAGALVSRIRRAGLTPLLGDHEISDRRMIQPSIEDAVLRSDIFVALWSRSYAQSRWCYDELDFALHRGGVNGLRIWLFNLDGSDIVPRAARALPQALTPHPDQLADTVLDFIRRASEIAPGVSTGN